MYYEINGGILPKVRLVDRAVLEPPYVHRRRKPDEYILYIMIKGILYLREGGRDYELKKGDVLLLEPDFEHRGLKASSCEYYYIHFRHPEIRKREDEDDLMNSLIKLRNQSLCQDCGSYEVYKNANICIPKYVSFNNEPAFLRISQLVSEAVEQNRNQMEYFKTVCQCRVMELLIAIARENVSSWNPRAVTGSPVSFHKVQQLLNYLNVNYPEEISGAGIEEQFAWNFDYLNRVFKKSVGKTVFSYLGEIRIRHAMRLLETTSMKASAVGYQVGFQDESYFSKVFKKYTGLSPGQYGRLTGAELRGYSLEGPFPGTPAEEVGYSAEDFIHGKSDPAAGQPHI